MLNILINLDFSLNKTATVLIAVAVLAFLDLTARLRHRQEHYIFAGLLGTALAIGLIKFTQLLLSPSIQQNVYTVALGVLLIVIAWKLLFGPWEADTKAAVLGTFVFWIAFHILVHETPEQRLAHLLAAGVALVPAVIWCLLFLEYHRERLSLVLLMFFAGMLSTAPVLFYDTLVRAHAQLHFFFIRIIPESFNQTAESFVSGQLGTPGSVSATVVTLFLSFTLVGLIEEGSKLWVLRRNGAPFCSSIAEVMEFGIIIAIGFAFAENIINPSYFIGFVREYLLNPAQRDWFGFFGNVIGRSILTSMVHIVSTGMMGYFLGRAIFAQPLLDDAGAKRRFPIANALHALLRLERATIVRWQMILTGLVIAMLLHATSNFLVTLPDALPGNPRTLGALLGMAEGSPLHYISLLLLPSLLYVVGGFWLITELFERRSIQQERGHPNLIETFVATER